MRAHLQAGLLLLSLVAGCATPRTPPAGAPRPVAADTVTSSGAAQSEALEEAYRRGSELYRAGRYAEAETFWREALVHSERERGRPCREFRV